MSDQYLGEIRMFTGGVGIRVPEGWAFCDGSEQSISGNEALYALIGTTYGGDGVSTFKLPDLRGRVPIHTGTSPAFGTPYPLGSTGGKETVTLNESNLPPHTHPVNVASGAGKATTPSPANAFPATGAINLYAAPGTVAGPMNNGMLSVSGGNQAHNNMMPFLTIGFIIALQGIFPTTS